MNPTNAARVTTCTGLRAGIGASLRKLFATVLVSLCLSIRSYMAYYMPAWMERRPKSRRLLTCLGFWSITVTEPVAVRTMHIQSSISQLAGGLMAEVPDIECPGCQAIYTPEPRMAVIVTYDEPQYNHIVSACPFCQHWLVLFFADPSFLTMGFPQVHNSYPPIKHQGGVRPAYEPARRKGGKSQCRGDGRV